MPREPIPTWFFVLVAVRRGDEFLLVQESRGTPAWYLPAGRVEEGEDLVEAAERETLEEAGIRVTIDGIMRIEHTPTWRDARVRLIFTATPVDDTPPKSVPDGESLGAAWFTLDEMAGLPLRGMEVLGIFNYLKSGGMVMPISFLAREGSPFRDGG